MEHDDINWIALTNDLMTILDEIEMKADDESIQALCKMRFDVSEKHGLTIEFEQQKSSSWFM